MTPTSHKVGAVTTGLMFALICSSCAVGPDFKRPSAPKATGYAPVALADPKTQTPGNSADAQHFVMGRDIPFAWWTQFQSSKLNALVETALKANPNIPAAQAALRQAQEYVSARRGFFYPTVGATFNAERQELSGNTGGNSPGIQGNGSTISTYQNPSGPAPFNGPVYYNFYTAQLSLSFVPDVFGGNRRQVESLQAQADAQRFQLEATYVTLASNVVAAAIQQASLQSQLIATQALIAQNMKAVEIRRQQLKLGYATGIDVATQESMLAQAKALLPPLQKQLEQTHDLLRALCGNLPDQALDDSFDLSTLHLPEELPVSLPSALVEQRPDVRAAEEQLHAASAAVGVAIADRLPQFSITATKGGNASEIGQMFSTGGPFGSIAGNVTQTLFDGGTLLHQERAAKQALALAQAQYRSTVITAFQNVADTLHAIQDDADALSAATESQQAAQRVLTITRQQYQLGYVDYMTQLNAESAYQQAQVTLLQARTNRLGDTAALYQALGGGWWNRSP